jgi:hypothetical protein
MKKPVLLSASLVVLAMCGMASSAYADSNEAMCEVRKDGQTRHGQSGPCTFSQRQGYIDLDLRNGDTYSLRPGNEPNHFKDQKGNKVVRTQAGGNTQEFKWEGGKKIVVTFGTSSASGGGGAAAGAIAVADMSRYCAGEASAKFGVSPRDITTQNAKQTQGMYEVWGQYGTNAQVFICSFNAERQFLSVDLYRP